MLTASNSFAYKNSVFSSLVFIFSIFHFDTFAQNEDLGKPNLPSKSSIVVQDASDGSFSDYFFYDDSGKIVKKIRHDQFESRHPVCRLSVLSTKTHDSLPEYYHVLPLRKDKDSESGARRLNPSVVEELKSLKKLGIIVKTPEKASVIIGCPSSERPVISLPAMKYLTTIETTCILDYSAKEIEGQGNALVDCSYLTIYNYHGNIIKEILVPDKIVTSATVSDDGNFLMCSYSYTYLWDEGMNIMPEGILIADLNSGKIDYLSKIETKQSLNPGSNLFADNYFQVTIGNPWSGDSCIRMYINPYDRKYYIKAYGEDRQKSRKPIFPARSFIQFEGVIESPLKFNSFSY